MKTYEDVLSALRSGERKTNCWIDGRDMVRLADFVRPDDWDALGVGLADDADPSSMPAPRPWTVHEFARQVLDDARFGLMKAEDERGISSAMMVGVLTTWSWILEDETIDGRDVTGYGARFFRDAVARYERILQSTEPEEKDADVVLAKDAKAFV